MFGRKNRALSGPSVKHEFVPRNDERSGLALGASHYNASQAGQLAFADASMRQHPCGVRGCGRLRDDPIHEI